MVVASVKFPGALYLLLNRAADLAAPAALGCQPSGSFVLLVSSPREQAQK